MQPDWQKHVVASSGYLDLGMFDDATLALEEIEPEDKTRTEVPRARIALYIAAKKWDMAAAVANQLVKVEPQNEAWWINLAYSARRSEGAGRSHSTEGASHAPQGCHDRIQPGLLCAAT